MPSKFHKFKKNIKWYLKNRFHYSQAMADAAITKEEQYIRNHFGVGISSAGLARRIAEKDVKR